MILSLGNDVLAEILSHLDGDALLQLQQVCKHFYHLIHSYRWQFLKPKQTCLHGNLFICRRVNVPTGYDPTIQVGRRLQQNDIFFFKISNLGEWISFGVATGTTFDGLYVCGSDPNSFNCGHYYDGMNNYIKLNSVVVTVPNYKPNIGVLCSIGVDYYQSAIILGVNHRHSIIKTILPSQMLFPVLSVGNGTEVEIKFSVQ